VATAVPELRAEVREFFALEENESFIFDYGDAVETFNGKYHRIPFSECCWLAGNRNFNLVSKVIICSSAMEAVAFYHFHYYDYPQPERIVFLSLGLRPNNAQFRWINSNLAGKHFTLVFGNTMLDKAAELVIAAALSKKPLNIKFTAELAIIHFRRKTYYMPLVELSLGAFDKLSGFRFSVKTNSPKHYDNYFTQWKQTSLSGHRPYSLY
jgi:hypothetical protein